MKILAIETSCDETACAVVKDGAKVLSSVVASSREFHEKTGGIVPEIASRKQMEYIVPVIEQTLKQLKTENPERCLGALAVTVGPGLIGSLVVGVEAAKTLSLVWDKPLVPVNHLTGHIYANFIGNSELIKYPAVALVVSGGHTDLVLMKSPSDLQHLGGTLDDAAGEAFDKTARILGLSQYLGGALLSELAATCSENTIKNTLPRPMADKDNYDFSFSGLKTAVKRLAETGVYPKEQVACEFENAVIDVLEIKVKKALRQYSPKTLLIGGGVAANTQLRNRMRLLSKETGISLFIPAIELCTDNAISIATAAYYNYTPKPLNKIEASPSLDIMSTF